MSWTQLHLSAFGGGNYVTKLGYKGISTFNILSNLHNVVNSTAFASFWIFYFFKNKLWNVLYMTLRILSAQCVLGASNIVGCNWKWIGPWPIGACFYLESFHPPSRWNYIDTMEPKPAHRMVSQILWYI